jgi:hypothetical protein
MGTGGLKLIGIEAPEAAGVEFINGEQPGSASPKPQERSSAGQVVSPHQIPETHMRRHKAEQA